jgi:caa(3)-type oxidase subunit IV
MADHYDSKAFVRYYRKIYFTLVILLVVSVLGPFFGIVWVTLITAFGIAFVKATLVAQNFMQLKWERRLIRWMLTASLVLMALFVAGVAPDIMEHEGQLWVNEAAMAAVERGIDAEPVEGGGVEAETDVLETDVVEVEPGAFDARGAFNLACAACHGQAGDGTGPAGLALDPSPASFIDPAFWETRDGERIYTAIRDGAAAVGGSPLMVPWRNSYDDEQIRALAEYVMGFRPGAQ